MFDHKYFVALCKLTDIQRVALGENSRDTPRAATERQWCHNCVDMRLDQFLGPQLTNDSMTRSYAMLCLILAHFSR